MQDGSPTVEVEFEVEFGAVFKAVTSHCVRSFPSEDLNFLGYLFEDTTIVVSVTFTPNLGSYHLHIEL